MSVINFSPEVEELLDEIIVEYNRIFKNIRRNAITEPEGRAYGGVIRSTVGGFVEWMAEKLVHATWIVLNKNLNSLNFKNTKYKLPILPEYVENIKIPEVKQCIKDNIDEYTYGIGQDIHVYEGDNFILSIECKAYTENAILKRIMVDAYFMKQIFPNLKTALIQMESQLGGDYSELRVLSFGSKPSHTIMSYFDVELAIITLLEGPRKVNEPIHNPQFYKLLTKENLKRGIKQLAQLLA